MSYKFIDRKTPVTIHFVDASQHKAEWPFDLCTKECVTGRDEPAGNVQLKLRQIQPDGTHVYDEVPGTFTPLPVERKTP